MKRRFESSRSGCRVRFGRDLLIRSRLYWRYQDYICLAGNPRPVARLKGRAARNEPRTADTRPARGR